MSNAVNEQLLERGYELLEEITNHPSGLEQTLAKALEDKDLDEVYRLVSIIEGELAQEHFFNHDIV